MLIQRIGDVAERRGTNLHQLLFALRSSERGCQAARVPRHAPCKRSRTRRQRQGLTIAIAETSHRAVHRKLFAVGAPCRIESHHRARIHLEHCHRQVFAFEPRTVQVSCESCGADHVRPGDPFEDVDVVDGQLNLAAAARLQDRTALCAIAAQRFAGPHHAALVHEPRVAVHHVAQPTARDHVP